MEKKTNNVNKPRAAKTIKGSTKTRVAIKPEHIPRIVLPKVKVRRRRGASSHFSSHKKLIKSVGYGLVCTLIVCIGWGLFSIFGLQFGFEAIVDGKSVGIISSAKNFNAVLDDARSLVAAASAISGETPPPLDGSLIPRIISNEEATSEWALRQNLLGSSGQLAEGYAIYVNNKIVCASSFEEEAFAALDALLLQYNSGGTLQAEFLDKVAVRKENVPLSIFLSQDGIISALNGNSRHAEVYNVENDEAAFNIADRFEMPLDELLALNKNMADPVAAGTKVNVMTTESVLRVQTKSVETFEVEEAYPTESAEDGTIPTGKTVIKQAGVTGLVDVTATIISINGAEQERVVISETRKRDSEPEYVLVGTGPASKEIASSSGWIRPTTGSITSPFGTRGSETHTGIDFGATYGAIVKAAVGGKVIMSAWNGNYGYCVRIDSGGGLVEIYAHCSQLLVKEGQTVAQGDVIAKVGSTGRSTGPHLHFEIRKNGVAVNPAWYLN